MDKEEGQSDDYVDEAEEEEEEEEQSPLSQRRSSATQHRQQQQQEKPEATTDGDVSRSMPETRRSELALQLGNGVRHNRGMVRARSAIPASCTTSSMSMIASLISLEAFRTSKEKQQEQQQQTKSAFAANVPAQVHYFCSVTSALILSLSYYCHLRHRRRRPFTPKYLSDYIIRPRPFPISLSGHRIVYHSVSFCQDNQSMAKRQALALKKKRHLIGYWHLQEGHNNRIMLQYS